MGALGRFFKQWYALLAVIGAFAWSGLAIVSYRTEQAPAGAITIRLGHWQLEASVRDGIDEMAKRYRELVNPHVYVMQDAIPEGLYGQWVSTQLMGNTAPDIMQVGNFLPYPVWLAYYSRYFTPLTRYVNAPNPHNAGTALANKPLRQTYKDGMKTAYVVELQEYISVPLSQFGVRVFFNQDLLQRLTGQETAPRTYREFLALCQKIAVQKDEQGRFFVPIAGSGYHFGMWAGMMFDPLTYSAIRKADFNRDAELGNDEFFVAVKTGRMDFNYEPYRLRFQIQREVTDFFQTGYTGLSRDEAVFLFAQQRAVFMTTGTWDARSLEQQAAGRFRVGVMDFPLPTRDDPVYGHFIEGRNYESIDAGFRFAISRNSRHFDVARDFLLFLASQKQNEALNKIIGWIPAIEGTEMDPMLRAFEPNLEGVYAAFPTVLGGETAIRWGQLFSLFQVGKIDYAGMIEQYAPFYLEQGLQDYLEQQREWRRGMQRNEQFLAGIRAKALSSEGDEATSNWVKYRSLTAQRQVWDEINHSRQLKLINLQMKLPEVGPYEYSPSVLQKIKERVKKEMREPVERTSSLPSPGPGAPPS
jgi:raffinose/stachyose/melibiose transport system substrate-binding protein